MPKFRKKPVVIDAVRYDGSKDSVDEVLAFCNEGCSGLDLQAMYFSAHREMRIKTLESRAGESLVADPGDWVIRGVRGEFYPCKPDIFEATYERVDQVGIRMTAHEYHATYCRCGGANMRDVEAVTPGEGGRP